MLLLTFVIKTDREYPKFVIQEMTVNSVCHRDYSIKGTEIQIKMFDNRLVFETPGKLPGIVRTDNIRHTHFSRNPKIAEYLKAYDYVKEFGEGVDRMCRELSAIGTKEPQYHLVAFIMKASVWANLLEEGQEKTISDQKRPDKNGMICKVSVAFPEMEKWGDFERCYLNYKSMLSEKYGEPKDCFCLRL